MRVTRRSIAIGILFVLVTAAPALAVGPNDGAYAVVQTLPGAPTLHATLVILQNGSGIGVMFLYPEGFWVFGFSILSDTNRIQGNLTQTDGSHYGFFDLTLANGAVNGTVEELGVTYNATGQRFF
jgi:hypothetical protein